MQGIDRYNSVFNQAFDFIKRERDPHFDVQFLDPVQAAPISTPMFQFSNAPFDTYNNWLNTAKKHSIGAIRTIISSLNLENGSPFEIIDKHVVRKNGSTVLFMLKEKSSSTLFLFLEVEKERFWKMPNKEPEEICAIMDTTLSKSCKYIYLTLENAFDLVIGHTDDPTDPGRGFNVYSLKWFLCSFFGVNEYAQFEFAFFHYRQMVSDYLGISCVRSLNSSALINFRRITEREIKRIDYIRLKNQKITNKFGNTYILPTPDIELIKKQYIDDGKFSIMLGTADFSESFITAEWLFDSMKIAQAVDLTAIGTGYFKCIEQLIFSLICLFRNQGLSIQKNFVCKSIREKHVLLCDSTVENDIVDSTMGSMANFIKENSNVILRQDISTTARNYVRESVFKYTELRNGYFHKHNIKDISRIQEIRDVSFDIMFLLLGSFNITQDQVLQLGAPRIRQLNDFDLLCEYVNYHENDLFIIELEAGLKLHVVGKRDPSSQLLNGFQVNYSGAYFGSLSPSRKILKFTENNCPLKVFHAKLKLGGYGIAKIDIVEDALLYENGKFLGCRVFDEESFSY